MGQVSVSPILVHGVREEGREVEVEHGLNREGVWIPIHRPEYTT